MIYHDVQSPVGLASKLATYIADPSTIQAHVKSFFGRAPSIEKIKELRAKVESEKSRVTRYHDDRFVTRCTRHNGPYELDADGYDRCAVCKEEKRKAEAEKADAAARMAKQLAALKARAERDRQKRETLAEEARARELAVAEQVLRNTGKPIVYSDLLVSVAAAFEMTPAEILGRSNARHYVDARTAIARILCIRGNSYSQIAKRLARKDHSTVCNLLNTYPERAKRNPLIALVVDRLA